jgi:hypothetical protein
MNTIYKQCAHCGAPIKLSTILPHHSPGGSLWSDGYFDTPGVPEPPVLGKCWACGAIGCLTELPTMEGAVQPPDGADCDVIPLTLDDYALLLDNLQEISAHFHSYLRVRFWQLNNDRRRRKGDDIPLSDVEQTNLTELLQLLGEEDANRLLKVEIFRQLQEFEAARMLLNTILSDMANGRFNEQYGPLVARLRQSIAEGNARLMIIHP